jgi:molybdate transport system substrate-binding protein
VAAAADLKFALDQLVTEFQTNQSVVRVKVTYGSSGNFFAQLQNRAPFDLYFSADIDYPRRLAEAGHALDTNVFLYAVGRIVVWAPKSSPVEVEELGIQSLFAPPVKKIAIANPRHAPYGVAAVAAMKSLEVYERAESRLVFGENIAQTAQFVETGNAQVGILALSLALSPQLTKRGAYWQIPDSLHAPLEQGYIVTKRAEGKPLAFRFAEFTAEETARAVLSRHGFELPAKTAAAEN